MRTRTARHRSVPGSVAPGVPTAAEPAGRALVARRHLVRIAGFGLVPMLSLFASVVLLPLISRNYGPLGWTALSIGQSTGAVMSIAVGLAWPIFGGNSVAAAGDLASRQAIYRLSVDSRLLAFAVLGPIGVLWAVLTTPAYPLEAALFSLGIALNGMSAAWYFAGEGRPGPLIRNEALVRMGTYAIAAVTIHIGLGLLSYAVLTLAGTTLSVVLNQRTVMRGAPSRAAGSLRAAARETLVQAPGLVAVLAQAAFLFGGPTIFSIAAAAVIANYTGAYQIQRSAYSGLIALPTSFVSWVGGATGEERRSRALRAMLVTLALLALFALLWALFADVAIAYLFGSRLTVSPAESWALFASITSLVVVKAVELVFVVPSGQVRRVYRATTGSSVLGIAAMAVGAHLFGVVGGLLGVVVAGMSALVYYAVTVRSDPTTKTAAVRVPEAV